VIPDGMNKKALVRETAFYCIDFPLGETHESLSFVTDDWLRDRAEDRAFHRIAHIANPILQRVLQQFKDKADRGLKVESDPFLLEDQQHINEWLDRSQHAKDYSRFDFIDRQKKLYSQPCTVNDEFFWLLTEAEHRKTIQGYCQRHDLSIEITPVTISAPGDISDNYFTIGYKFGHTPTPGAKASSSSALMLSSSTLQQQGDLSSNTGGPGSARDGQGGGTERGSRSKRNSAPTGSDKVTK